MSAAQAMVSKWRDGRDIPDARWGKQRLPGCECTDRFTCGACLDNGHKRWMAEINASPFREYWLGKK